MGRSEGTRLALMRAAERLLLERGVDQVSLREVGALAGQGNNSAALYHFKDKRGLIEGVLLRHSLGIEEAWFRRLAELDRDGSASLPVLLNLLVESLVRKLDDEDGGRAYLTLCAELLTSRTIPLMETKSAQGAGSAELLRRILERTDEIDPAVLPTRMLEFAALLFGAIYQHAHLRDLGAALPQAEFVRELTGSLEALVTRPSRSA